jgi:hypothetical protein
LIFRDLPSVAIYVKNNNLVSVEIETNT